MWELYERLLESRSRFVRKLSMRSFLQIMRFLSVSVYVTRSAIFFVYYNSSTR